MHIDKWRVSLGLLKETVETFVTFGEMQHCLWTVKEYEEVDVWRKCWHWCCPVISFGHACKCDWIVRKKIQTSEISMFRPCFHFVWLFVCFIVHSKTTALNMGHVVSFTLKIIRKWCLKTPPPPSSCLPDPSKENELCSLCYYSGRTTFIKNLQENVTA